MGPSFSSTTGILLGADWVAGECSTFAAGFAENSLEAGRVTPEFEMGALGWLTLATVSVDEIDCPAVGAVCVCFIALDAVAEFEFTSELGFVLAETLDGFPIRPARGESLTVVMEASAGVLTIASETPVRVPNITPTMALSMESAIWTA